MSKKDEADKKPKPSHKQELARRNAAIVGSFQKLDTRIKKIEAYREANLNISMDMFTQRLKLLDAMASNWRDPETGEFDPQQLRRAGVETQLRQWFHELQNLEKQAGLLPTVKQERTVTVTLADQFKQMRNNYDEHVVDAEVIDEQ